MRWPDGDTRHLDEKELLFGVDPNSGVIIRRDNSEIDARTKIDDYSIEFALNKRLPLKIDRMTGRISGERKGSSPGSSSVITYTGLCEKRDSIARKF